MIYTGFTFAPIPNWDAVMTVKAPSNYKKPEAIAKYIAERKAELAAGAAADNLLTGTVTGIAVIAENDSKPQLLTAPDEIADFFMTAVEETTQGKGVVGYRIHRAMKLLAVVNAVHGNALGNSIPVGHFKWIDECHNKVGGFIDPVSLLFGSSDVSITDAAIRLGVSVDPASAPALAEFARVAMRNIDLGP